MVEYSLFGERHSGTNWVERLLYSYFGARCDWKHGYKHWKPLRSIAYDDSAVVVVVRQPVEWIQAMHRKPWHAPLHVGVTFEQFIRSPWRSYYGPWEIPENESLCEDDLIEHYETIFELRAVKLQSFLSLAENRPKFALIRYEDLCENPLVVLRETGRLLGWRQRHLGFLLTRPSAKRKVYPALSRDSLEFLRDNIDWQVESLAGYSEYDCISEAEMDRSSRR